MYAIFIALVIQACLLATIALLVHLLVRCPLGGIRERVLMLLLTFIVIIMDATRLCQVKVAKNFAPEQLERRGRLLVAEVGHGFSIVIFIVMVVVAASSSPC